MMLFVFLQAVLTAGQFSDTWCGQPECPAKPQCTNAALDLIIAIDESCSMSQNDWAKEKRFAAELANAAERRFNISRFAGVVFGYNATNGYAAPVPRTSRIFHSMTSGAAAFNTSLPGIFDCGGTPTDEALYWFYDELNRTRVPDRMQVAVLVTDGIPTLCYTAGGNCSGTSTQPNAKRATDAAIAERFSVTKLPRLGSLMLTVGIGSALNDDVGPTVRYGNVTGKKLLENFASSPRMAFLATNFNVLINETLGQVLDLLCFYVIDVIQPPPATCYSSGTRFIIRGYNVFPLGTPKCRWQEVGTLNYLYTNATINVTNQSFPPEPGFIGLISCPAPPVPKDTFNAILEISRDGTYYTNNQYSLLLRSNCSAPIPPPPCPNATIDTLFRSCNASDFQLGCSPTCKAASDALGTAFVAFSQQQAQDCVTNFPSTQVTASVRALIGSKAGPNQGPCTPAATSGACGFVVSFALFICGIFLPA